MFFKKSPTIKYLLIFLVISAMLFVVVFYFNRETAPPNSDDTPVVVDPSDIANWLTYEDLKYGYSIKYPPGWKVIEHKEEPWWCGVDDDKPCGKSMSIFIDSPSKTLAPIQVMASIDNDGLPLEEDLKKRGWKVEEKCKPIVINDVEGLNCGLSIVFEYKDFIYWISWADYYGAVNEVSLMEFLKIFPDIELTPEIAAGLSMEEAKEFNASIVKRFASTFRILKD